MDYKIEYTDKEITPWAGILMLKKMLDRMEFDSCLETLALPEQGSNRGYSSDQLIKQFMTSVLVCANKFEHTEVTRQDEVIRQFWEFERMAGHKSFQRFFNLCKLSRVAAEVKKVSYPSEIIMVALVDFYFTNPDTVV